MQLKIECTAKNPAHLLEVRATAQPSDQRRTTYLPNMPIYGDLCQLRGNGSAVAASPPLKQL